MPDHNPGPPQDPPPPASPPPPAVERITGRGHVLHDGVPVIEIDYDLTISPGTTASPQREPISPGSAHPDISGQLLGPFYTGERLLGIHTLVLEDGRDFDFRVIQPDTNEIVSVSALRAPGSRRTGASR